MCKQDSQCHWRDKMKRRSPNAVSLRSSLMTLGLLLAIVLACGNSSSLSNPALNNLLGARSQKEFNDALLAHGSVREDELPAIFEATSSSTDYRRRNAAQLLRTTIKGNAVELEHRVILETKYVDVWAIVLDDLMQKDESLAGKRPDMIKGALEVSDPDTLAVGLRAAALSNYPGASELARKYLDHKDAKVRAAAVSGLSPEDVRELLPRLNDMISKETDEDTFIMLARSLIRTNDDSAANVVIKALESLKVKGDDLYVHFFNDPALFTTPDPIITKFLFLLVRGRSTMRDEGFSVFSRWVWSIKQEPNHEFVRVCIDEIKKGNVSTDPRRRPEASSEQDDCELMLSFMNNGKNPIDDFQGRVRGKDAIAFAEKWLKEHGG
jgi:hypothetical protein